MYRNSDPWTSQQGPHNVLKLETLVLNAIAASPHGLTAGEVGDATPGYDGLWKRMSVLEKKQLIMRNGTRFYNKTGRHQTVWILSDKQLPLL